MFRSIMLGFVAFVCVGCGNKGTVKYSNTSENVRVPPGAVVYSYAEVSEGCLGTIPWYEFQYKGQCFLRSFSGDNSVMVNIECPDSLKEK